MQLVDALKTPWKQSIREQNTNLNGLSLYDHHLIKNNQVYPPGKLNSKEIFNILILGNYEKPTSQGYFKAFFESETIDKKYIYLLPLLTQNIAHFNTKFYIMSSI